MSSRTLNGPEQPLLPASVGNPNSIEREVDHSDCDDDEMEESKQSGHAASKKQHLSLKCLGIQVEYVDGDDLSSGLLQPTSSGRPRDAMSHGQVEVASGLDQSPKAMVVLSLGEGGGRHSTIVTALRR